MSRVVVQDDDAEDETPYFKVVVKMVEKVISIEQGDCGFSTLG